MLGSLNSNPDAIIWHSPFRKYRVPKPLKNGQNVLSMAEDSSLKMASTPKPTDSAPESAKPEAAKPPETSHNLLDLMEKNALAPVVNSLGVDNVNTGANMLNEALTLSTSAINAMWPKADLKAYQVGKLHDMEVGKVEKGSIGYYSQQILGTGASFVGYAIAGKVAGKVLRTVGEAAPMGMAIGEINIGSGIRAAAQDARVANVLGATTYAGFKDTKDGESHLSNAVSTFASFSMFEAGNSAINPAASTLLKIGQRAVVGYAGGAIQANVASRIQTGKWADSTEVNAAGLSGAALNALLPGGRQALDHGLELTGRLPHTTEATARLHEAALKALPEGQAPEPGSWADRNAIKSLNKAARVDLNTRVKLNDEGPTSIDQKKNVVTHQAGDDPLNVLQELAHRRINKEPIYEQAFQSSAKQIHWPDQNGQSHTTALENHDIANRNALEGVGTSEFRPEKFPDPADPKNAAAREGYINTRLDQEVAARTAQNQEAEKLGAKRRVSVDRDDILTKEGYKAHFESEADDFIRSGGKTRPGIDYSGGGGGHAGGHASGDVGHVVNTVSQAHAENVGHGHPDGVGGGTGARTTASDASGTREKVGIGGEEYERSDDPTDWPAIKDQNRHTAKGYEAPSEEYPRGRDFVWFSYPGGAHVNGHDNVVWGAQYDADVNEVMLVKRDPNTLERSAVRMRNDGKIIDNAEDGRGGNFTATSVEKMYYQEANDVPLNLLFDSNKGLRAIKYEVEEGNDLIPDNTTYTRYAYPQLYDIDGVDITPAASVEYHDGSGRIDYHQDQPFQNIITEWPEPRQDGDVRYRVSVPQAIPGSHRVFALDANNKQTGIVDFFSPDHPLDTDFGQAIRVDREGPSTTYQLKDGSAVRIIHYDGQMIQTHLTNGIEETKIYGEGEGYSEKYSSPWETVFGLSNEVKVTASKAEYHLVNGGVADLYSEPTTFKNFKNVDWVYHDPSGDNAIQLHDGSKTRVLVPKDGIDTGVAGVKNAVGMTSFEGVGGFNRYYLDNGAPMDVLPSNPGLGIIRTPGRLTLIGGVNGNWKEATFLFKTGELPEIVEADATNGVRRSEQPFEKCIDDDGNFLDLYPEVYPNGLLTKWGLASERHTYWTGGSTLKLIDGTKDGRLIELDLNGDRVIRNSQNEIIGTEKEPNAYPHLENVAPPRRVVNSKDFPQPIVPTDPDAAVIEEEPILDEPPPEEHHDTAGNEDLLDNPDE
jgi:hypothetical protein